MVQTAACVTCIPAFVTGLTPAVNNMPKTTLHTLADAWVHCNPAQAVTTAAIFQAAAAGDNIA
jgi:hypothetical protein